MSRDVIVLIFLISPPLLHDLPGCIFSAAAAAAAAGRQKAASSA